MPQNRFRQRFEAVLADVEIAQPGERENAQGSELSPVVVKIEKDR